jgi:hypothetical protein
LNSPAHLDGCTIVVLRAQGWSFRIVESGRLSFDGQVLTLVGDGGERSFSDTEAEALILVTTENQIPECQGFDFFLIAEDDAC